MSSSRPPLDQLLVERVRPVTLARDRQFPVLPVLERLLPAGLQQGVVVGVTADRSGGATSLALMVAAGASAAGGWTAAVGLPDVGLVAAEQHGVCLERFVSVECRPGVAGQVVSHLVDGFPMVLVGPGMLAARDGRRVLARLRDPGSVLVMVGCDLPGATSLRLAVTSRWDHHDDVGPDGSVPLLTRRVFAVSASGRGVYGTERHDELLAVGHTFGSRGLEVVSQGTAVRPRAVVNG